MNDYNLDILTVLYNQKGLDLFHKNSPSWAKNVPLKIRFLIACPPEMRKEINIPDGCDIKFFDFKRPDPKPWGDNCSLQHAHNLHQMLGSVEASHLLTIDADVQFRGSWEKDDFEELIDKYDVFGFPYHKTRGIPPAAPPYQTFPFVSCIFFKSDVFFDYCKKTKVCDEKYYWVFSPEAENTGFEDLAIFQNKDYYKYFQEEQARQGYSERDTGWLLAIVFKDLVEQGKVFLVPQVDETALFDIDYVHNSICIRHELHGTFKESKEYQDIMMSREKDIPHNIYWYIKGNSKDQIKERIELRDNVK